MLTRKALAETTKKPENHARVPCSSERLHSTTLMIVAFNYFRVNCQYFIFIKPCSALPKSSTKSVVFTNSLPTPSKTSCSSRSNYAEHLHSQRPIIGIGSTITESCWFSARWGICLLALSTVTQKNAIYQATSTHMKNPTSISFSEQFGPVIVPARTCPLTIVWIALTRSLQWCVATYPISSQIVKWLSVHASMTLSSALQRCRNS